MCTFTTFGAEASQRQCWTASNLERVFLDSWIEEPEIGLDPLAGSLHSIQVESQL